MQSITFAALASVAAAISDFELEFANYAARFNKVYGDIEEFAMRFENFLYWHKVINEHNSTDETNNIWPFHHKNFKLGHNQFSDWSNKEYAAILTLGASDAKNHEYGDYVNVFDSDNTNDSDDSDLAE